MPRILATLAIAALIGFAAAAPAVAATLRPTATVEGAVIRLGDLFADAGAHAADVVAPAPPPGSRTIFDAAWLAATAREHQLDWQPASPFDRASVERATRSIAADAITRRLLDEIATRQSIDGAEIQLDNPALRLQVPAEAGDAIAVDSLSIDPRSGRLTAMIAAPAGSAEADRARVTGRLIRMVELPVLARPVAPGETIAAQDIESLKLRAERIGADTITDRRELVGKTPRRALRAHEPLHAADVQAPIVVHKGDLVTIVLETPSLRLTAQGKALEDGALGAAIRIANTKSNRVIDATVTGPNLAAVTPPAQLAAR